MTNIVFRSQQHVKAGRTKLRRPAGTDPSAFTSPPGQGFIGARGSSLADRGASRHAGTAGDGPVFAFARLDISPVMGYDLLSRNRDNDASSHAIITTFSIGAYQWP
jgi:hypothetical protein